MALAVRQVWSEAETGYCRRVLLAMPPGGFGAQLAVMTAWLDANCGPNGWGWARAGTDGIVNDALAFYFVEVPHASAFIRRFCCAYRSRVSPET